MIVEQQNRAALSFINTFIHHVKMAHRDSFIAESTNHMWIQLGVVLVGVVKYRHEM